MPYSSLLRGRTSEVGRAYLLTVVCHKRCPVFLDMGPARMVVAEMRSIVSEQRFESLAWVLMPDHLHWLITLRQGTLAQAMKRFKARSQQRLHDARLWQRGYHDHALRDGEDAVAVARYVIANPVRAGLVQSVRDYSHWDAVWLTDWLD